MDTDRASAKAAIKADTVEEADPERSQTLAEAKRYAAEAEVVREKNRHAEAMAKGEQGLIGRLIGGSSGAPLNIGLLALLIGVGAWAWCLYNANGDAANTEFWRTQADRALALSATALGFVFGRTTS